MSTETTPDPQPPSGKPITEAEICLDKTFKAAYFMLDKPVYSSLTAKTTTLRATEMGISFVFFVATIVMTKADKAKIDVAKSDKEFLQGTWIPVAMAQNGKVMTLDQYTREVTDDKLQRMTFSGDTCFVEIHEPDETIRIEKSRFTLDPNHRPKRIDIFREDEIYHAIYSVSTHELRICVRSGGGPPPTAFQTKGEPDLRLCTFKRQQAQKPPR